MAAAPLASHVGLLGGLVAIVAFDVAGEVLARAAGVPLPGPVIGMVLLFVALLATGGRTLRVERGAALLLRHMSLFFVPAGVGVVTKLDVIRASFCPIVVALVVSTCLGLLAAAAAFTFVARRGSAAARTRDRA